ncbi:MAG TPA: response regulator [Polyangia bacterium]|nr:response regulator [Polyangia bacterium]
MAEDDTDPDRPRVAGPLRVHFRSLDELVLSYSNDLSRGGLFVETDDDWSQLPLNSLLRLHLELPDQGGTISVMGRIVHVHTSQDAALSGKPAGLGLEFARNDHEWLQRIEQFIARSSVVSADKTGPIPITPTLRLLVVEDDDGYRELLSQLFRRRGDRVRTARDGIDALALCLKETPDIILCDLQMPRMDGWQLLRVVRSRPKLQSVPFVFLTTLDGESARLAGYQLGVDDYIPKPCGAEELTARVDRAVQRAHAGVTARDAGHERKTTLRGDLEQVSLPAVLSLLELEKKTGVLTLDGPGRARLTLRRGHPLRLEVHGSSRKAQVVDLLGEILGWSWGTFELSPEAVSGKDEIGLTLTELLIASAHRADERNR